MKKSYTDDFVTVVPKKVSTFFSRGGASNGSYADDEGVGEYYLSLDVTAVKEPIYVPISVASGRQSTGFIYHIEGTGEATTKASITGRGEGVSKVTSGSIIYFKIETGKTVEFNLSFKVTGRLHKKYQVVVSRINYKLNTNDSRYKRFLVEIGTKILGFS